VVTHVTLSDTKWFYSKRQFVTELYVSVAKYINVIIKCSLYVFSTSVGNCSCFVFFMLKMFFFSV